jgi:hypothetical protein
MEADLPRSGLRSRSSDHRFCRPIDGRHPSEVELDSRGPAAKDLTEGILDDIDRCAVEVALD